MSAIILILLVCVALKVIFRRKPKDFMEGRLVHRSAAATLSIEESTRLMREQFARNRELALATRDALDAYESKYYREHLARCARKSQHLFL
jgi:hypothetical protein